MPRATAINNIRSNWTIFATLIGVAVTYGAESTRLSQMSDRLEAVEASKPEVMRSQIDRINSDDAIIRGDVAGIRTDVAHTREDVSFIRGALEHRGIK